MRKKSIRKNKTNRKKTYRKKTNRKKSIHKKTNHKKTYLKKRNIQRGGGDLDFTDPEIAEALLEEMEEKEEQLRLAAEFGQGLLDKTEELQEENKALEREKDAALVKAEEAEQRVRELEESMATFENLESELRGEILDANARAEDEKSGYEDEKSRNEERLRDILESVNGLGLLTEGDSYIEETDTEYIESTLKNMADVIEGKIKQQIKLGTAKATQSLMEAQMEQATLHDRILELEKEVKEAKGLRDKAIQGKDRALVSLEKEISKNLEIIARNQEVVEEHVNAKNVFREQNKTYEAENTLYRNDNTELREQNEKLTIELAKKEDCIEKTRQALGDGEEGGDEDDDLE